MTEEEAVQTVRRFVVGELGEDAALEVQVVRDGPGTWAFWITPDDTTSYLHDDGRIEWLGTAWEPGWVPPLDWSPGGET